MSEILIHSKFGVHRCKPMVCADITDSVSESEIFELITSESKSDNTEISEVAPKATSSPQEDSSVEDDTIFED